MPLIITSQQPAFEGGCASITERATCARFLRRRTPRKRAPNAAFQAATSPPNGEETPKFDEAAIREIAFQNCQMEGASFRNALPESVQFDYGSRLFGTVAVVEALRSRSVAGIDPEDEEELEDLVQEWRDDVQQLMTSRMRRFYVAGSDGSKGSKWDSSILELNLLGGLDQFNRRFTTSKLIPELVKAGVLNRVREHGNVVYRLNSEAKDDARRLIEEEEVSGLIATAFERLAAS